MMEWTPLSAMQLDYLDNSTARLNIADGPVRSGKTVSCLLRLGEFAKTGPYGDFVIIGKTERTIFRNVIKPLSEMFGSRHVRFNAGRGVLKLFGRDIDIIGASDIAAEAKVRGSTYAGAYVNEITLIPEQVIKQLFARLSVKGAMMFGDTNPDSPYHWFYKEYLTNEELLDEGILRRWKFVLADNTSLDPRYVQSLKKLYKGVWYNRMIEGQWVMAEGQVYDMFNPDIHIVKTQPRDYEEHYVSIDYGTQNPMTFGLWGRVDKQWIKMKEYFYSGRETKVQKTDQEYCEDLRDFVADIMDPEEDNVPLRAVVVDPSATSFITAAKKKGFRVVNADNDVSNGINNVASALSDGRVLYNDCCTNTIREFNSYVWDEKAVLKGVDRPLEKDDHCMDSDRYFIHTIVYGKRRVIKRLSAKPAGF